MERERRAYRRTLADQSQLSAQLVHQRISLEAKLTWLQEFEPVAQHYSAFMPAAVTACVVTPNEQHVAVGLQTGAVHLVDLEDQSAVTVLEGHSAEVQTLAVTADSKYLVSGSRDKRVVVWQISSQTMVAMQKSHSKQVLAVCVASDGKTVYSSGRDQRVIIWNWVKDVEKPPIALPRTEAHAMQVTSDKLWLLLGCSNGDILVWNTRESKVARTCSGHSWPVTGVCFSSDQQFIVSASMDHSVRLWDFHSGTQTGVLDRKSESVPCLSLTGDNKYAVYGSQDGYVCIARATKHSQYDVLEVLAHSSRVSCVSASRSGRYVVSGSQDHTYKVLKLSEFPKERTLDGPEMTVHALKLLPEHGLLAAASGDKNVYIWQLDNTQYTHLLSGQEELVTSLDLNQAGTRCVTGGNDGSVVVWDIAAEAELARMRHSSDRVNCVLISADQSYLLVGSMHNCIILWSMTSFDKVVELIDTNGFVRTLRDSTTCFYAGGTGKVISVWSYSTFNLLQTLKGHTAAVSALAVSPTLLVSGGHDSTIRLWERREYLCVGVLKSNFTHCNQLEVAGDFIYSVSDSYTLTLWSVANKAELGELYERPKLYACAVTREQLVFSSEAKVVVTRPPTHQSRKAGVRVVPYKYSYLFKSLLHTFLHDTTHKFDLSFAKHTLLPWNISMMHILSYLDCPKALSSLIAEGCQFTRTSTGETALSIALARGSVACAERIVELFPTHILREHPGCAEFITGELEALNKANMPALRQFYKSLMPLVEYQHLPTYGVFREKPPVIRTHVTQRIDPSRFVFEVESKQQSAMVFRQSLVKLNLSLGSTDSITFFRSLHSCEDVDVFRSEFISAVLLYKWSQIKPLLWLQTGLYIVMLLLLLWFALDQQGSFSLLGLLVVLNSVFFAYEVVQMVAQRELYFVSAPTLLDLLRILAFYAFAIAVFAEAKAATIRVALSLLVVGFWLRLVAYIRMFEATRYLIRMLFVIVGQLGPFFLTFVTLTLSFMLGFYVAAAFDLSFDFALLHTYTLSYGEFMGEGYSILEAVLFFGGTLSLALMMLNLVIALMTHTFKQVQNRLYLLDRKVMATIILELDCACFWRRNTGQKEYLQECTLPKSKTQTKRRHKTTTVESLRQSYAELTQKLEQVNQALSVLADVAEPEETYHLLNGADNLLTALRHLQGLRPQVTAKF